MRLPSSNSGTVELSATGKGNNHGLWSKVGLHSRFLAAVVAVQSAGVRATAQHVWREMQARGVTGGTEGQIQHHIHDYCRVLLRSGVQAQPGNSSTTTQVCAV